MAAVHPNQQIRLPHPVVPQIYSGRGCLGSKLGVLLDVDESGRDENLSKLEDTIIINATPSQDVDTSSMNLTTLASQDAHECANGAITRSISEYSLRN